jgi:hypothetical protein
MKGYEDLSINVFGLKELTVSIDSSSSSSSSNSSMSSSSSSSEFSDSSSESSFLDFFFLADVFVAVALRLGAFLLTFLLLSV